MTLITLRLQVCKPKFGFHIDLTNVYIMLRFLVQLFEKYGILKILMHIIKFIVLRNFLII